MTPTAHPSDDTIRVLFIEADAAVSEMYKLKLELDGYQVAVVPNDDQVLAEAARTRPDMIFIDLTLGDARGFATLERLRAADRTRGLPVIILSNQAASGAAGRAFKTDVLDYVVRADTGPNALVWNVEALARAVSD